MKVYKALSLLMVFVVILTACTSTTTPSTRSVTPTSGLPTPQLYVTSAPDAKAAATAFLTSWKNNDFSAMYASLTKLSQGSITEDDFTKKYTSFAQALTLQSLEYDIQSILTNPKNAKVACKLTFKTTLFSDLSRQLEMNLALEDSKWQVQWDDSLMMPELKGGNQLRLDVKVPARGDIYDRTGQALAAQSEIVALGIVPGEITNEDTLLQQLSELTGKTAVSIKASYENAGPDWYIPVGEAPRSEISARWDILSNLGGLRMNEYSARYYFENGAGPQLVGYVLSISPEELDAYKRKGYAGDEKVGASGLEKWGEQYLVGKPGADLYVVNSSGEIQTRLAQASATPSQSIYTTLDRGFQVMVQQAIQSFRGAAVVIERDTGRVLAMASSPTYDPNLFDANNYNRGWLLESMLNDPNRPLVNRAAQSAYPLGSVFKIITMAAALESGIFTKDSTYDCQYEFTELDGQVFYDWTKDHDVPPSGLLTLPEGLMRSCNPWFYHIGLQLYRQNRPEDVSKMARAFGLGEATGIGAVAEETGNIPDPESEGDAVQLAIGQGSMLVTPLQVADFIAAVGNGGTLYKPQVIEKIAGTDGTASYEFKSEVRGKLPISEENLKIIQDAMYNVVYNRRGTAILAFTGMAAYNIHGKTGTATNPNGKPHGWFACYTDAGRADKPDIAVVVLAENAGEGSETAAYEARRIIEAYFTGRAGRLYPWEANYNVTKTATPEVTDTPTPEETATP